MEKDKVKDNTKVDSLVNEGNSLNKFLIKKLGIRVSEVVLLAGIFLLWSNPTFTLLNKSAVYIYIKNIVSPLLLFLGKYYWIILLVLLALSFVGKIVNELIDKFGDLSSNLFGNENEFHVFHYDKNETYETNRDFFPYLMMKKLEFFLTTFWIYWFFFSVLFSTISANYFPKDIWRLDWFVVVGPGFGKSLMILLLVVNCGRVVLSFIFNKTATLHMEPRDIDTVFGEHLYKYNRLGMHTYNTPDYGDCNQLTIALLEERYTDKTRYIVATAVTSHTKWVEDTWLTNAYIPKEDLEKYSMSTDNRYRDSGEPKETIEANRLHDLEKNTKKKEKKIQMMEVPDPVEERMQKYMIEIYTYNYEIAKDYYEKEVLKRTKKSDEE